MKKILFTMCCLLMIATTAFAQDNIEKIRDYKDGKVAITNAKKLFSGCNMRLCYFQSNNREAYGIELDMTDHVETTVGKGDLLIINFNDGTNIRLSNLFDTEANVSTESHVETRDNVKTSFVPVYSGYYDAVFAVPVVRHNTEFVPVTTSSTFADLYYVITEEQIQKIIEGGIQDVTIVTDSGNIVRKARPLSKNMAALYKAIQK